jgi:hypothetical protein
MTAAGVQLLIVVLHQHGTPVDSTGEGDPLEDLVSREVYLTTPITDHATRGSHESEGRVEIGQRGGRGRGSDCEGHRLVMVSVDQRGSTTTLSFKMETPQVQVAVSEAANGGGLWKMEVMDPYQLRRGWKWRSIST